MLHCINSCSKQDELTWSIVMFVGTLNSPSHLVCESGLDKANEFFEMRQNLQICN